MEPTPSKPTKTDAATGAPGKVVKESKKHAAKEPKSNKVKPPKEDVCVFAFRLTRADRDLIHKAAGPANASRFVKSAALAGCTSWKWRSERCGVALGMSLHYDSAKEVSCPNAATCQPPSVTWLS